MPWLTGNATTPTTGRRLLIPDDETFIAAVRGALLDLTREQNWQQFGTVTPQEAASAALEMLLSMSEVDSMPTTGARVRITQTLPSVNSGLSGTTLAFDTEDYDYGDCWSIAFPRRLVAPANGIYLIHAELKMTYSANGSLSLRVDRGPGFPLTIGMNSVKMNTGDGNMSYIRLALPYYISAGQYVELNVAQNSGSTQFIDTTTTTPIFSLSRLS